MKIANPRYFYHSFPRRSLQDPPEPHNEKGLRILESIVKYGFLMTPEVVEWHERLPYRGQPELFPMLQKRICFTELSRSELRQHGDEFGRFAIEYEIPSLRQLGALPVIYVPAAEQAIGFEAIGITMVHRLAEIQDLLAALDGILKIRVDSPNGEERLTEKGRDVGCGVSEAQNLVRSLFENRVPADALINFLTAFFGLFYPTEDTPATELMKYYREREWRISGRMEKDDVPATAEVPQELLQDLLVPCLRK